jgi:hypothetical protein
MKMNLPALMIFGLALAADALGPDLPGNLSWTDGLNLRCGIDPATALPVRIETRLAGTKRNWLLAPVQLTVRNEVTGASDTTLAISQRWAATPGGLAWEFDFTSEAKRVGHEVVLDLPILSTNLLVFTPTERGMMAVQSHPTFKPAPYAAMSWDTGDSYVLPLISVFDPQSDHALTVALPADANIPHLQFRWSDAKTLRLTLAHRGMGGGKPSPLKLLFFAHAADYRSVLKAYSDAFPEWFKPPLPRGPYEGAFWYHHIQDHPAFAEMARQNVRYIWSSFWFTHLGEYLPDEKEWMPYTYAKWWNLGQTMCDDMIRAFVRTMHEHGIGTYAYFNVTEYGGAGGQRGDTASADRILWEQFAGALVKDAGGKPIPTWEGAMAMNPGRQYTLWPFLEEQVRRHLSRLPETDGFIIDRLDWASGFDYGHDDGLSMIGDRPAANLAVPVGEAVREVARLSHTAGKRVFVNQFYRLEVLRDVDGVCHENDYLPALGYLTPLRPASAWHMRKPYQGDLLQFEAQLKRRLQWALFPQMIAHQFPISQQAPNPQAADLLEIYAPLFDTLIGKEQVLLPHCIGVSGVNDVNLFRDQAGHYVVPVTSRVRFLSRQGFATESVTVIVRVPDASALKWAYAISADGPPYQATLSREKGAVQVTAARHGTATMLVLGENSKPDFDARLFASIAQTRDRLFGHAGPGPKSVERPALPRGPHGILRITGTHVGVPGSVRISSDGKILGEIPNGGHGVALDLSGAQWPHKPPVISLAAADEGVWFVPNHIELLNKLADGQVHRVAQWLAGTTVASGGLPMASCFPELVVNNVAHFADTDTNTAGQWKGKYGKLAVWIPNVAGDETPQNGFRLQLQEGQSFTWSASASADKRVPQSPQKSAAAATCWFADDHLQLNVTPPDATPYRLTLYALDYDRNGRALEVSLADDLAPLDTRRVSIAETAGGVYLTWTVTGPMNVTVRLLAGFNAVLSAVFVDDSAGKTP